MTMTDSNTDEELPDQPIAQLIACDCCAEDVDVDTTVVCAGDTYCDSCLPHATFICAWCTDRLPNSLADTPRAYRNNVTICDQCVDYYASSCDACGEVLHTEDLVYDDCYDTYICEDCHSRRPANRVNSYGYKPHPIFFDLGPDDESPRVFMGMELEIEYCDGDVDSIISHAQETWTNTDATYLKEDGSLNFGVEIVSHPMTLGWAQKNLNRHAIEAMRLSGARSWNAGTCGIHIHVDRKAFRNSAHIAAFMMLIHRSANEMQRLAGRRSGRWASYDYGTKLAKKAKGLVTQETRYDVINLDNSATVEIRAFRGSLNADTMLSHMELLDAMVRYTRENRPTMAVDSMLDWAQFVSWVSKRPERYSHLLARIEQRITAVTAPVDPDDGDDEVPF